MPRSYQTLEKTDGTSAPQKEQHVAKNYVSFVHIGLKEGVNIPRTKVQRFKPGTVALREIRKFQKTTTNLIPRAPFLRLVKEIVEEMKSNLRFQSVAVEALREAAEAYIIGLLNDSYECSIHAKRSFRCLISHF